MTRSGAAFLAPWPLQTNPHLNHARGDAIDWMKSHGLLHDEDSVQAFVSWRLAEVAAWFYPHANAEDLCVAARMMGWYFLPFDDQLDGEGGRNAENVTEVIGTLISIVNGEFSPRLAVDTPTVRAFADLWPQMTAGSSPALLARLRFHWTSYFSSQVTEALDRATGFVFRNLDDYFAFRAATTCAFGQNDLAEKWGGMEVDPTVWHHPALARLRQLGADLVAIRNDSMSTPHEDVQGLHNTIHIIEATRGCSREEAVAEASAIAQCKIAEIVELEQTNLPRIMAEISVERRAALNGYTDIIHNWIVGDYEWEQVSTRNESHRETPEWATTLLFPQGG
ncbi:terpene synthase family protein [Rhizomonospora bruguierae]|uniref:terpene synthase family protein n=1 Tax=Rhizomonospora bruguierae TaxID=1581705 RepID=UPI001BCC280C|nr:hypothetical protein [Micromonospora sp. NBRC 107566]